MTLQTGNLVVGQVPIADAGIPVPPWPKAPKAYGTFSTIGANAAGGIALTAAPWPKAPKAYGTFSTIGAYAPPLYQFWG